MQKRKKIFCRILYYTNIFLNADNNFYMIKPTKNIKTIKENILSYYNTDVDVKVNLGRNKIVKFSGRLSGVYPALFTVAPHDKNYRGKTAYSYSDILCGTVKIKKHE